MELRGLGSLYLAVFLDSYGAFMVLPLLPFLALSLNASAFEVGLMQASYCFTQTIGTIFLGALSDRVGRRRVLVVTLLFCSFSLLAFGLSSAMWQLILFRALHGFFASTVSVCEAIIADAMEPAQRASAMATVMSAFGLGVVLGPGTGGLLVQFGFEVVCFVAAGLTFFNGVWAWLQLEAKQEGEGTLAEGGAFASMGQAFEIAKTNRDLVIVYVMTFAQTMAFGAFMGLGPLYLHDIYGIGGTGMGAIFATGGLILVVCQGPMTRLAVTHLGELESILTGSVVRIACLLAFALIVAPVMPWIVFLGLVAAGSLIDPCMASVVATMATDENRGALLGVYQALRSLGECLGPLWAGAWYEQSHRGPFFGCAVSAAIGGLFVSLLRIREKGQETLLPREPAAEEVITNASLSLPFGPPTIGRSDSSFGSRSPKGYSPKGRAAFGDVPII